MNNDNAAHWQNIYATKQPHEVSWTQAIPQTSLQFIHNLHLPLSASIIDIGGGESRLVDYLVNDGFSNISVLDISSTALNKTKERLGGDAEKVKWIETDITDFIPKEKYDVWHDRAAFHFLTSPVQKEKYIALANEFVNKYLIIATFSTTGPLKCSGLQIQQYDASSLNKLFEENFILIDTKTEDHTTPFGTTQNFLWCVFKRKH